MIATNLSDAHDPGYPSNFRVHTTILFQATKIKFEVIFQNFPELKSFTGKIVKKTSVLITIFGKIFFIFVQKTIIQNFS